MALSFIKKSQLYFIFSFASIIVLGAVMLKLPFVSHDSGELRWIDAFFTATSAVCVTGLTTVVTSGFNLAGQFILLLLIQLGAIGIMTLTASVVVLLGRSMSFSSTLIFSNLSDKFPLRGVDGLLKTVLTYTFLIEAGGFVLLALGFLFSGQYSLLESVHQALFHAVSAFCNAGFSLFDDSLIRVSPFIKVTVAGLIVLGGLGVYVIYDLVNFSKKHRFLRIHTRLVLFTSFILIVVGAGAIKIFEHFEGGESISWLDAFFQSITARTAGFNTIPMEWLHPSSIIMLITLMLIGASPGSTGGGMKTTTAALVFISIYNTFKGNRDVLLSKRSIAHSNVLKAFTIMFSFIFLLVIGAILISVSSQATLQAAFFEAASALGTVGLSLGVSANAGVFCKIVLIACMFIGRIGPFTLFLFLLSKEKSSRLEYPPERIIIG